MNRLTRYNPTEELSAMVRLADRLLEDSLAWHSRPRGLSSRFAQRLAAYAGDNLPVDMYEMDDAFVIEAALPGLKPKDIQLESREGYLSIRAKAEVEQERSGYVWRVKERRLESWQRTLALPPAANLAKAHARLKNGVLTVSVPKQVARKVKVNRIPVNFPRLKLPRMGKDGKQIRIQ